MCVVEKVPVLARLQRCPSFCALFAGLSGLGSTPTTSVVVGDDRHVGL